jgi:hypothetical protein
MIDDPSPSRRLWGHRSLADHEVYSGPSSLSSRPPLSYETNSFRLHSARRNLLAPEAVSRPATASIVATILSPGAGGGGGYAIHVPVHRSSSKCFQTGAVNMGPACVLAPTVFIFFTTNVLS